MRNTPTKTGRPSRNVYLTKRAEWANMVIDAWIKRNSGKLGKHSTRSKKSS